MTQRAEELKEAGVVEERLGLHALGTEDPESVRCVLGCSKDRRLPDPGLTNDDQSSGTGLPSGLEQPFDPLKLLMAADHGSQVDCELGGLPEAVTAAGLSGSNHDKPAPEHESIDTPADSRSAVLLVRLDRMEDGNAGRAPARFRLVGAPEVTAEHGLVTATIRAYNDHDLPRLAELHDPSARIKFAGVDGDIGLDAWWSSLEAVFAMLPDFTLKPLTVLADDEAAMIEMDLTGTNSGEIPLSETDQKSLGVDVDRLPPTGRVVEVTGVVVLRIAGGRVSGETHHWPRFWLDEGLGLVTVEARPRGVTLAAHSL
jgi:hypothetical protein